MNHRELLRRAIVLAAIAAGQLAMLASAASHASAAVAAPATMKPPVGTPDLSQMAPRPTDLPPGTIVKRQGYIREEGYIAAYGREFGPTRVGHARVIALGSVIGLDKSAGIASLTLSELQLVSTQRQLARETLQAVRGHGSRRVRKVTVRKPHTLPIGDGAFVLPMTLYTSLGRMQVAYAVAVRDRVEAVMLVVAAPGSRLTANDVAPLLAATTDHVQAGLSPINIASPTVSGLAQQGKPLTAAPGAWSNRPVSFAYRWQRCDARGAGCVAIPGATGRSYLVGAADAGATLRVAVTATNKVGHAVSVSTQTPVVQSPADRL